MTTFTIPKKLIRDDLVIIPKKEYERLLYITKILPKEQLWFWTREWQKKEKKAEREIRQRKIHGPFFSGKELLKSLKSKK